jgi:hypothetical protein
MFEEVPRVRRRFRRRLFAPRSFTSRSFNIGPFAIDDDVALVTAAGLVGSSIAGPVSWRPTLSPTG